MPEPRLPAPAVGAKLFIPGIVNNKGKLFILSYVVEPSWKEVILLQTS